MPKEQAILLAVHCHQSVCTRQDTFSSSRGLFSSIHRFFKPLLCLVTTTCVQCFLLCLCGHHSQMLLVLLLCDAYPSALAFVKMNTNINNHNNLQQMATMLKRPKIPRWCLWWWWGWWQNDNDDIIDNDNDNNNSYFVSTCLLLSLCGQPCCCGNLFK